MPFLSHNQHCQGTEMYGRQSAVKKLGTPSPSQSKEYVVVKDKVGTLVQASPCNVIQAHGTWYFLPC